SSLYDEFLKKYKSDGGKRRLERQQNQKMAIIDRMVKEGKRLLAQWRKDGVSQEDRQAAIGNVLTVGEVGGTLWIWSTVHNRPTKIVIDTGAKSSVISLAILKEWGLESQIDTSEIASLVGASGDSLKVKGTIRLPVQALRQRWIRMTTRSSLNHTVRIELERVIV
ncbi:MAG: hypothetical protein ACK56F_08285, partial [bacterium]